MDDDIGDGANVAYRLGSINRCVVVVEFVIDTRQLAENADHVAVFAAQIAGVIRIVRIERLQDGYCILFFFDVHFLYLNFHTPVGILSKACTKVEGKPFPMHLTKPVAEMFDTLGRHSTFLYRMIFANMWCFGWVIDLLGKSSGGEMNALCRTTVAFTQMEGSSARNVIPPEAKMVANMRLNPADSVASALDYLKKVVGDENVEITALESFEPSRISQTGCEAWDKVSAAVAETWKGCIVAPYLMVQCSDSRHYGRISDKVYRFSAMDLTSEERATIHGNNERIRLDCAARAVEFYIRLMKKC